MSCRRGTFPSPDQPGDGNSDRVRLLGPAQVGDCKRGVGGSVQPRHHARPRPPQPAAHGRVDQRSAPDRARSAGTNAGLHGAHRCAGRLADGKPQKRDRSRNRGAGRRVGRRHDRGERGSSNAVCLLHSWRRSGNLPAEHAADVSKSRRVPRTAWEPVRHSELDRAIEVSRYSLDVVNGVITSTQPGGSIY